MKLTKIIEGAVGISLAVCMSFVPVQAEEESFQEFMDEQFKEMMESDYTTLHYALRDYESLGIEKPEVTIGSNSWESYAEAVEEDQETLKELESFDYDSLTDTEKADYDTYKRYLENSIALNSYPYFDFAFNSASGIIDNIITTFTEFVFYEDADIDDYLTCLESVPEFMDDCIEVTKIQAEAGYFLTGTMLSESCDAIDKFVEKTEDNALIISFNDAVDAYEGISDAQKETYKERNRDIILNEVIPAYQKVEDELNSLAGSRKGGYSVYDLEGGEEYYLALARYKTSLDTDIQGMLDVCNEYMERAISELYALYGEISEEEENEQMNFESAEEVLSYLENHLDAFPEGPEVTYTASYLDPSIANDSIVAYYMEPPIDDIKDNVIKINGDNVGDTNELYITLAHEGFPGHLYQITWYLNTNPSRLRTQLINYGYQEGWGMYAESEALKVSELSENAAKLNDLYTGISYVMDAAVDLGVNGLGWSVTDIKEYLSGMGLNEEIASDLYDFVTSEPGVILPYGVGLAEFANLRYKAEQALGDDFDAVEYHTVLLTNGDRPFSLVEKDVDAYIKASGNEEGLTSSPQTNVQSPAAATGSKVVYIVIGCGIAAVGVIAFIQLHRSRKEKLM